MFINAFVSKITVLLVCSLLLFCNNSNPVYSNDLTVTDADGNSYKTIKIGNQIWTIDNFKSTKYNDGSAILKITDSASWATSTIPAYCYYNNTNNSDIINKFGILYNGYSISIQKFAPLGWHIPTIAEWDTLENYLIQNGYNWDGSTVGNGVVKSLSAKSEWFPDTTAGSPGNNMDKNNKSGFSALPGGFREADGLFRSLGYIGMWWSSTYCMQGCLEARGICICSSYLGKPGGSLNYGYSVRLIKDK